MRAVFLLLMLSGSALAQSNLVTILSLSPGYGQQWRAEIKSGKETLKILLQGVPADTAAVHDKKVSLESEVAAMEKRLADEETAIRKNLRVVEYDSPAHRALTQRSYRLEDDQEV